MKRAALILFHVASALSLVLCLAAIGLWWRGVQVARTTPRSFQSISVHHGEFFLWSSRGTLGIVPGMYFGWSYQPAPDLDLSDTGPVAGFFFGHFKDEHNEVIETLLPVWFVLPLLAILPLAAGVLYVRRRRRHGRLAAGRCIVCGYDLRTSPDRCPECGAAVPTAQPARPGGSGG